MSLSIPSNRDFQVAFKINIAGTSAHPSQVKVQVERDELSLGFIAEQKNDEWIATLTDLGRIFSDGEATLSIAIVVNNRLFTPMKKSATLKAVIDDTTSVEVENITVSARTTETSASQNAVKVEELADNSVETEAPPVDAPVIVPTIKLDLMKMIDPLTVNVKPKISASTVKRILGPTTNVPKPDITAEQVGILRSLEPSTKRRTVSAAKRIAEAAPPPSKSPSSFSMKRIKIVTE